MVSELQIIHPGDEHALFLLVGLLTDNEYQKGMVKCGLFTSSIPFKTSKSGKLFALNIAIKGEEPRRQYKNRGRN